MEKEKKKHTENLLDSEETEAENEKKRKRTLDDDGEEEEKAWTRLRRWKQH